MTMDRNDEIGHKPDGERYSENDAPTKKFSKEAPTFMYAPQGQAAKIARGVMVKYRSVLRELAK